MKAAFMTDDQGHVQSCLVEDHVRPTAFDVGSVYVFGCFFDYGPFGIVPPDVDVVVESHDYDTGVVMLVCHMPGSIVEIDMLPFQCEDTLAVLNTAKANPVKGAPKTHNTLPSVANRASRLLCIEAS